LATSPSKVTVALYASVSMPVEGKGLMQLVGDDQVGVRIEPPVHRIERRRGPVEDLAGNVGLVRLEIVVVHLDGDDVVGSELHRRGDVETGGADLVLLDADLRPVDVEGSRVADALKLEEDLPVLSARVESEVLPVPTEPAVRPHDGGVGGEAHPVYELIDVVERVREADVGPLRIVKRRRLRPGDVLSNELPTVVEAVERAVVGRGRRNDSDPPIGARGAVERTGGAVGGTYAAVGRRGVAGVVRRARPVPVVPWRSPTSARKHMRREKEGDPRQDAQMLAHARLHARPFSKSCAKRSTPARLAVFGFNALRDFPMAAP
jgi:hypothetical protein